MSQIVHAKSPLLAVVTDWAEYVRARHQAETLSAKYGLSVADMPMVIRAMITHPEVRETIRPVSIDTITSEYHGQRDGNRSYEVWHSAGSLATVKGLQTLFSKTGEYGFMPISDDEWVAVGKGSYNGQTVARIHLEDARKGNVPAPGTPYTLFARLDKDRLTINGNGQLKYDTFMQDDRVLMITGSPESRAALAKLLFGKKRGASESRSTIGSYHKINEMSFDVQAKGRMLVLSDGYDGLIGSDVFVNVGRFVGVAPEAQSVEKNASLKIVYPTNASLKIVYPTLEQILAGINNPDQKQC